MIKTIRTKYIIPLIFLAFILVSCQDAGKDSTGSEYMPEMTHSIAFEANTYAYYPRNTFSTPDKYYEMAKPRTPVEGTVPRGSINTDMHPYYYGSTEEERTRATEEIIENPLEITEKNLEKGKQLYTIYCAICHGDKGDSKGYLVRDDGGKYLALPANFMTDDLIESSNGRYYHALMRGKNVMAAYNDKLDYEERWMVIQYVRSLQAEYRGLEYNHLVNTLNTTDKPGGVTPEVEIDRSPDREVKPGESHGNEAH
jgi:mono/diheme cytochrome c family protein